MKNIHDKNRYKEAYEMYENIVRLIQTKEQSNIDLAVQTAVGTNNPVFWSRFDALLLGLGKEHTRKLKKVLSIINETKECFIVIPSTCNKVCDFRLFPNLHTISLAIGNISSKYVPILPSHISYLYLRSKEGECLSSAMVHKMLSNVVKAQQVSLMGVSASNNVVIDLSCADGVVVCSESKDSSIFNSGVILSKDIDFLDTGFVDIEPLLNWLSSTDYINHARIWITDYETSEVSKLIDSQKYWDWHLEFHKERLSLLQK